MVLLPGAPPPISIFHSPYIDKNHKVDKKKSHIFTLHNHKVDEKSRISSKKRKSTYIYLIHHSQS